MSLSGRLKASGFKVGKSALEEWFKGKRSPSDTRAVLKLAEILDTRAQALGRTTVVTLGRLKELVEAAQRESGRQRGGRPSKPTSPTAGRERGGGGGHAARAHAALAAYVPPAHLSGRDEELRELEAFCTAPEGAGSPYAWWQAGPWTGKSALMAHLVTRSQPRGVEFATYFISEVLQNNNREDFRKDLWKQLCDLAGRPAGRAGSAEELFALMDQAGQACRDRGRRLLLVVDALDEDAGARPGGASIAALLPKNPPAGMRVLVTGRPNPPLPDDVPTDHPLREAAAIRRLKPWPGARGIESAATRDIQHLLHSELGRTVLGLLAAAHGALSGVDLAELAQAPPFEMDRILRSTTGRSLIPATSPYQPPTSARRYLLGHAELHRAVTAQLGRSLIAGHERVLHTWADTYRGLRWHHQAPAYLLYDYPRLLTASGHTDGLLALALDPHRQRALLERGSADAALAHLDAARHATAQQQPVNLANLAALAVSQDLLAAYNAALPPFMAQAFVRLGQTERALDLARATDQPVDKAAQLASVATAMAHTGHHDAPEAAREAARWAQQARQEEMRGGDVETQQAIGEVAVAVMTAIPGPAGPAEGRALLADTHLLPATLGQDDDRLIHCHDETLPITLAARTSALTRPHDPAEADRLLDWAQDRLTTLTTPDETTYRTYHPRAVVAAIAATIQAAGPARAARLREQIATYAASVTTGLEAACARAAAASVLATDSPDQARALAHQAKDLLAAALSEPHSVSEDENALFAFLPVDALTEVVRALATTGAADEAHRLLQAVPERLTARAHTARAVLEDPAPTTCEALVRQALDLAERGDTDAAERCLAGALQAHATNPARANTPRWKERRLTHLAGALASAGQTRQARTLADSLTDPCNRIEALSRAALQTQPGAESLTLARASACLAQHLPPAGPRWLDLSWHGQADATGLAAQALAHNGRTQDALALADRIAATHAASGRRARTAIAAALAEHDPDTAAALIDTASAWATTDSPAAQHGGQIPELVELLAAIGHTHPACRNRILQAIDVAWTARARPVTDMAVWLSLIVIETPTQPAQARTILEQLYSKAEFGDPEETQMTGFAIAHATFGNLQSAHRAAARYWTSWERSEASLALAAYLTGTPPGPRLPSEATSTAFTQTLHTLALQQTPPDTTAGADPATQLIAEALRFGAWHQALPVLQTVSPDAVDQIRDIVFTHRHLQVTPPDGA
ncbi:hypothetical protein [Kitasatospora aureofaciens]|uniref:hypothetical protein n=1 Tax=Kitasatospora aureofaciens TaxID=1894 RepID=UPI000526D7D9|nr:hypothetical protein [Kitasatospora aureofaciens]